MYQIYREEDFKNIFLIALSRVSENKIIGLQYNARRIYEMDLLTDKISYLSEIPINQDDEYKLYHKSVVYNEKIYFLPFNCTTIAVMDLNNLEFEMIEIPMLRQKDYVQAINVYIEKNIILMIPYQGGRFIRFDMDTYRVIEYYDFSDTIGDDLLCSYAIYEEGKIMLPSMTSNKIYTLNTNDKSISYIQISEERDSFSGISVWGNNIWLVLKNRFGFLKYDIESKKWKLVDKYWKQICVNGNSYFDSKNIFFINHKMVCMPAFANAAIEIDLEDEIISEISELNQYIESKMNDDTRFVFDGNCASGDTRFLCYQEFGLVEFDLLSKKTILHRFNKKITEDCLKLLIEKCDYGEKNENSRKQ